MKKKIVVLVGIALCTMLLISPALASGVDTLDIYGNANEDDTIDMRDLTYVKLIFFGKKPETELADAKYDGKINPLDFIQIKLIIVGKEKELTIVDSVGRVVTVPQPLTRVIPMSGILAQVIRMLEQEDKVVGVPYYFKKKSYPELFPVMHDKPPVGSEWKPDYEAIVQCKPQIVLLGVYYKEKIPTWEDKLEPAGIGIVAIDLKANIYDTGLTKMGWMFREENRAKSISDWRHKYLDLVEERVKDLKPEERTRVYTEGWSPWQTAAKGASYHELIVAAGCKNIFGELSVPLPTVDPEEVAKRNPQVIIKGGRDTTGYDVNDDSEAKKLREELMGRPILKETEAVKEGRVYIIDSAVSSERTVVGVAYLAKRSYPDLFEDLHPEEIHKEWFDKWYRVPYQGIYVYPSAS